MKIKIIVYVSSILMPFSSAVHAQIKKFTLNDMKKEPSQKIKEKKEQDENFDEDSLVEIIKKKSQVFEKKIKKNKNIYKGEEK